MKLYITREQFSTMLTQLCSQILPIKDQFTHVVGIERGGIPISSWLADTLGKKHHSILISRYGDREQPNGLHICRIIDLPRTPFLLVDDIVDSGETIQYFKELKCNFIPKFWVATLHWCPENSPHQKPDFYVDIKKKGDWIIYPWESQ